MSELYNPTIKDFLIVETDASQTTWADCMRALPNGKEKPSLNEKGEIEESKDLQTIKSIDYSASKILIKDNEKLHLCKYIYLWYVYRYRIQILYSGTGNSGMCKNIRKLESRITSIKIFITNRFQVSYRFLEIQN